MPRSVLEDSAQHPGAHGSVRALHPARDAQVPRRDGPCAQSCAWARAQHGGPAVQGVLCAAISCGAHDASRGQRARICNEQDDHSKAQDHARGVCNHVSLGFENCRYNLFVTSTLFLHFTDDVVCCLCVGPAVASQGVCQPFGFPSDINYVWQTLHGVVMRVDDSVLEKIFNDYPRLVTRVIEQMTDESSCQKRQALSIFQEAGTRIGTTLLKGKEVPRIEYLLALLSKLFFSATAVESIRVLVLQTVLVLAETYPFPSSLFQFLKNHLLVTGFIFDVCPSRGRCPEKH